MIVPSIDIVGGQAVQLVRGEDLAVEAGDPRPLMRRLSLVGEVAVVDIDAARGEGSNASLIEELCSMGRVRVGGGIRDAASALRWLDAGAQRVVIGTAASPELLRALPAERVVVALDSRDGEIVTHGWRESAGLSLSEAVERFAGICGGLLVTFVEIEGTLAGADLDRASEVVQRASGTPVTIAGGVASASDIAALDAMGAEAQVGMAIYDGTLDLADAFAAPLVSDREDGLWATVVVDERGHALGLAWSSRESLREAVSSGRGVYHSRSRGLWAKGATSGATQTLLSVSADCDRDALLFRVSQEQPGFCHLNTRTCWGPDHGLGRLARRIERIASDPPAGSNTAKLLADGQLLSSKLVEEARELAQAGAKEEVAEELADLLYFAMVKASSAGVDLAAVERILDRRERAVSRRPMAAKAET